MEEGDDECGRQEATEGMINETSSMPSMLYYIPFIT